MLHSKRPRKRSTDSGIGYEVFEPRTMLAAISVGNLNSGVAVSEDATGSGFILYSEQDVHERFSGIAAANADHFIATRLDGIQWQYNNDVEWVDFQSEDSDILVAEVNFNGDEVQHRFDASMIEGIPQRASFESIDVDNDVFVVANQFGGQFDKNEFQVLGTQFQSIDLSPGETTSAFFANSKISRIWHGALVHESKLHHFPTLANFNDSGEPLLSWRVHILPALGYQNLYEQFRFDEAWNSPHNLALSGQMPDVYHSNHFSSLNRTSFLAIAGEDTIFPLDNSLRGFSGESSLALVEANASHSVVWTQPVDWYFEPAAPLAGLGNASDDGFTAVDVHGIQYTLPAQVDPVAFANYVTINDGNLHDHSVFGTFQTTQKQSLRDLAFALHNYESSFMRFPYQSINADDGTPLLSWRVSILHFVGERNLYQQFHLDEPWDSPHNIQLLDQMPNIFSHPDVEFGKTVYLGLNGEGTFFDSGRTRSMNFGTLADGSSNTIMLVEADSSSAVEWSRPVDLSYDSANPSNGLGGLIEDGSFNAVLADAETVNFQPTTAEKLNAWATIAGGEISDYSFTDLVQSNSIASQLRQLMLASLNYESAHMEFPRTIYSTPRDTNGQEPGEPLLSWRVRILPFMEHNNLYQQFHLDEPWDSPHNLSLLPLMPRFFATEGVEIGKTVFQGAHGDNTFFSNTNRGRNFGNFGGNDNLATILQVNADQAIEWTKPGDFDFDANRLSEYLSNAQSSGFHFAMLDGSVHFFNNTLNDDVLKKIISPRDFQELDVDLKSFREDVFPSSYGQVATENNLRQLALAALNYESANMHFPLHAIYSEPRGGEPLLSWRVALLPYLGESDLYSRFNLDEPWDSPHNLSLLPLMPNHFKTYGVENGKTSYQAVASEFDGSGENLTIFPLTDRPRIGFGNIADGSSNTALFVVANADRAVEWTKPADLVFNPLDPTDGISKGTPAQGTNVVLADGSTHFIPGNVEEDFWGALMVINDGNLVDVSSPALTGTGTIVPKGGLGTNEDDTFAVTVSGDVAEVSINGVSSSVNVDDQGSLIFNGLGGNDTLSLFIGDIPVSVSNGAFQIGDLFSIATESVESISLGDSPVTLQGTDSNDIWNVDLSGDETSVTTPGLEARLLLNAAAELSIDGNGGTDQISFTSDQDTRLGYERFESGDQSTQWTNIDQIDVQGRLQDETSVRFLDSVRDDLFSFRGTGASMTAEDHPKITADGFSSFLIDATEGNDVARLSGTAETDDTFIGTPTGSRLTTPTITVIVNEFDLVAATSSGGNDLASMIGSPSTESFYAGQQSARLVGTDFILNATGFQRIIGDSGGGDDTASLTDSNGDDQFFARPEFSHFELSDNITITALNFLNVRALSSAGSDQAQLVGSVEDDKFVSRGNDFASLAIGDARAVAVGFLTVRSNGLGGLDSAFLNGSEADDYFYASPTISYLVGDGFQNALQSFESVVALDSLGRDSASFMDSAGDDRFYANPTVASIEGDSFFRLSIGFDFVTATSTRGTDTATLRDSADDDRFLASPTRAYLRNDIYHNEVRGFSNVKAVSTGGKDLATLFDSEGDDELRAFQASSSLTGDGFRNEAVGFDRVIAQASLGNDVVELFDSGLDDEFFGRNTLAVLRGDAYSIDANNFDTIDVFGFNGGSNKFFASETNYRWNRLGNWQS